MNTYELYNKYWECRQTFRDVEEVIENNIDFKFRFSDGKYSQNFLKTRYEYTKID